MTARLIQPTEPIEVKQLCCLIYGQPSSRKTSLAQTTDSPITLAFDPGIYRAFSRKAAVMFDSWPDVLAFGTNGYKTIVVDTVGACLSKLARAIMDDSPKNGNRMGGLSLPGYGVLKERFRAWVDGRKDSRQNLVFIAQEKDEKVGDEVYHCPDIVGGSYNTLMENCDLVGYMHFENGKRVLDFNPTDRWMAKAPPCGWEQIPLPDFASKPHFLQGLLDEAKASMGKVSEASASIAAAVAEFQAELAKDPNLAKFNALWAKGPTLQEPAKSQVKALLQAHAAKFGVTYDKETKAWKMNGETKVA